MIGSPDLLAFTAETDFREKPADSFELPEDLSVPPYPQSAESTPWSRTFKVKFEKDFILISEFSEQIGPQPLLTIPDKSKACGSFDLNDFSLRIMSVDYQTSFANPCSSGCVKLNFVEDSKVVLGDSKEGSYAYVHYLTLYDLEARGFVRPFCMAYVSSDEQKIMHNFIQLSDEFSKASECLKTGNRKNFANELEKKLGDLEYTRLVLLREIKAGSLQKLLISEDKGGIGSMNDRFVKERDQDSEKGKGTLLLSTEEQKSKNRCGLSVEEELKEHNGLVDLYEGEISSDVSSVVSHSHTLQLPDKTAELASVEKAIQEHRNLLKQVTSYPTRKLQRPDFLPYEPDDGPQSLETDVGFYIAHSQIAEPGVECNVFSHTSPSYTPQLVNSSSCRQFDKRLKNLDELCDEYFLQQAQKQLHYIEKSFRRDNGYLSSWQFTQNLLQDLKSTNFLFEDLCSLGAEMGQRFARPDRFARSTLLPVSPLHSEPVSLESYTSCVEMVPIKLEVNERGRPPVNAGSVPTSPCDDIPLTIEGDCEDEEVVSMPMKDSISSGDSIEVLGTEKSFRTQGSHMGIETVLQKPPLLHSLSLEHRKWRASARRMNSEDSIEVLSTTDSIIPEDLRASYPSAIDEETPEHEEEEERKVITPSKEDNAASFFTGRQVSRQNSQSNPGTPTIILTPPDTCVDSPLFKVSSQEPCLFAGPLFSMVDAGCAQEGQFQLTQDDFSDCTSYLSLASTLSDVSLLSISNGEKSVRANRRRCAKLGRVALRFLHHFPFAVHAIYSLLSGRTLVVLGSEEVMVRRWVTALTIYTPHMGRDRESIQPWTSNPLQITDLLNLKLVGFNRMASATSPNMPSCLGRFSRYLSVLDVDQRTLRAPAYKGSLIYPLVAPRIQISRGTTYFTFAQTVIGKLVSKAFLLAFSHGIYHPSSPSMKDRAKQVLADFHEDDMKVLCFLSEQIRMSFTETPSSVLRFSYPASTVFKC